jgi:tetratricopeptide (TPR) repeat protein
MQKRMNDASALYSYASFWASQQKNLDSALAAAKKSVELKPEQYSMWYGLYSVYYQMKNYPEAIKTIEKVIELAPDAMKETYKKQLEKVKTESQGKK